MLSTENVSAMPAVVPSLEETEILLAHRGVADCGVGVLFPVLMCWWAGHFGEVGGRNRRMREFVFAGFSESTLKCAAVGGRLLDCWSILDIF